MNRKKLDLNVLSRELTRLPKVEAFKVKGGGTPTNPSVPTYLPSVVITPSPSIPGGNPDFPDDGGWESHGGGGNGPGNGDDTPPVYLPSVVVTPSPSAPSFPSFPDDGDIDNSPDGPGGDPGDNGDDPDEEGSPVSDPEGILANYEAKMAESKALLEGMLKAGGLPAETVAKINEYLAVINQTLALIVEMKTNDGPAYRIESGTPPDGSGAYTHRDQSTGEIVITTTDPNDIALLGHELYHISQLLSGDISFAPDGSVEGLSLDDEVEAFQFQHVLYYGILAGSTDLGGNPVQGGGYEVTPEDVLHYYPQYGDLPAHDEPASPGSPSPH